MKVFRVWQGSSTLKSGNYEDVKGMCIYSVMRRFFGRGKLELIADNNGTMQVCKAVKSGGYNVLGYIIEI